MVAHGTVNSRQKSHFQTNIHMASIHRAMVSSTSPSPILHVHESVNILFELFAFSRWGWDIWAMDSGALNSGNAKCINLKLCWCQYRSDRYNQGHIDSRSI